jgi:hypothetical protein
MTKEVEMLWLKKLSAFLDNVADLFDPYNSDLKIILETEKLKHQKGEKK